MHSHPKINFRTFVLGKMNMPGVRVRKKESAVSTADNYIVVVVVVVCYENTGAGYGSLFLRARWVRQRGLCANSEPCDGYSTSSMLSTMRLSDVTRRILP